MIVPGVRRRDEGGRREMPQVETRRLAAIMFSDIWATLCKRMVMSL